MSTTFVKGDLFEDSVKDVPPPHAFAFAADCSGVLSRGIAIAFKKRWPAFADAYQARAENGKMQLGDVFKWSDEGKTVVIYALGIQRGEKKPKVSTLSRALEAMVRMATTEDGGVTRIALPRIGAGKGGIDRVRVKKVLTEIGEASPAVSLVVFEQFVRAKPEPDDAD